MNKILSLEGTESRRIDSYANRYNFISPPYFFLMNHANIEEFDHKQAGLKEVKFPQISKEEVEVSHSEKKVWGEDLGRKLPYKEGRYENAYHVWENGI